MTKLPDTYMWPNPFGVPIVLHYRGKDGGYVSVYSSKKNSNCRYEGYNTYLIGGIRVKGKYINDSFYPISYKPGENFKHDPKILKICNKHFPMNENYMWLAGNTIEWKNYEKIRPVYDDSPLPEEDLLQ